MFLELFEHVFDKKYCSLQLHIIIRTHFNIFLSHAKDPVQIRHQSLHNAVRKFLELHKSRGGHKIQHLDVYTCQITILLTCVLKRVSDLKLCEDLLHDEFVESDQQVPELEFVHPKMLLSFNAETQHTSLWKLTLLQLFQTFYLGLYSISYSFWQPITEHSRKHLTVFFAA